MGRWGWGCVVLFPCVKENQSIGVCGGRSGSGGTLFARRAQTVVLLILIVVGDVQGGFSAVAGYGAFYFLFLTDRFCAKAALARMSERSAVS